jgi:glutamine synthetase adenylyltransferase
MKNQILKSLKEYRENQLQWLAEQYDEDTKRLTDALDAQITYLEKEIREEAWAAYVGQLKAFKKHMLDSFDELMNENCTDESCTEFYNSDFTITFRDKTVTIHNSAESFQTIEEVLDAEIDNYEEV